MEKFTYKEAQATLEAARETGDGTVALMDYKGRIYRVLDGDIYCWPKPDESPRMKRKVIRMTVDLLFSNEWSRIS